MPETIAAIAEIAAGYFGSAAAGEAVYAIANIVVYAAELYALAKVEQALGPKPPKGAGRGLETAITDTGADGYAIFGQVRVSGVNGIPAITGGDSGRYLEQTLALAIHEIDGFSDVTFDSNVIQDGWITAITGSSSDGAVTSGMYAGKAWIRRYRGTSTQTVDFILNNRYPSSFTAAFRGRGIAYGALTYDWGDGKTYSGVPNALFLVRGARVYDPRLDSTNGGSGSHRVNDPTTWEFTHGGVQIGSNPALCFAFYAMAIFGGNVASANIDWASVAAAANICDAQVAIPGSLTQSRYTFNGRLTIAQDWRNNIPAFVDAMLGRIVRRGNVWSIYAGAWTAPSFTVNKLDWLSIDSLKTVQTRDGGHWNTCHVWFVDPTQNWQRVECYPRHNAAFQTADGNEEIPIPIEQPNCSYEYEAQRKGEITLRKSRDQIILSGVLPPKFRYVVTGDVGQFNFPEVGWVNKALRVANMELGSDGSVKMGLAEEHSSDWDDLLSTDYNAPSTATIPGNTPTSPTTPQNFNIIAINGTIQFGWDSPDVIPIGTRYRLWYAPTSLSDPGSKTLLWEGADLSKTAVFTTNSLYYYQVQAASNSYQSAYNPNTYGIGMSAGIPEPITFTGSGTAWGAAISPPSLIQNGSTAVLRTPSATVSVTNSNAPTFSWSAITSVGIVPDAASSRSTTFTGSGFANGENRSANFKCTVIDGVNSAAPVLPVTMARSTGGGGGGHLP